MASIAEIVSNDLCIGCGLCEAVTDQRVAMVMTERGSLRPGPLSAMTETEEQALIAACPGAVAVARPDPGSSVGDGDGDVAGVGEGQAFGGPPQADGVGGASTDLVWGEFRSMVMAWSGEPDVRFKAATGGVLTGLGRYLLDSGTVSFVLHVGPHPEQPLSNRWTFSETPDEVLANTGSRYAPAAPLAGFIAALDRGEPFAIIAKPCDLGAIHAYSSIDARVDELCIARLALVCGGQSRLTKTWSLLDRLGVDREELAEVRYRGHGNPGPTKVEAIDGRAFEVTYQEMWEDESTWEVETRCKFCPDALGECADVAAADAWPGGGPSGEDEGFNAVVIRTEFGERLVRQASEAGFLVVAEELSPRELDNFQPHQVRKKEVLAARLQGMADAGVAPIKTEGLRVEALGARVDSAVAQAQQDGASRRMRALSATDQ